MREGSDEEVMASDFRVRGLPTLITQEMQVELSTIYDLHCVQQLQTKPATGMQKMCMPTAAVFGIQDQHPTDHKFIVQWRQAHLYVHGLFGKGNTVTA